MQQDPGYSNCHCAIASIPSIVHAVIPVPMPCTSSTNAPHLPLHHCHILCTPLLSCYISPSSHLNFKSWCASSQFHHHPPVRPFQHSHTLWPCTLLHFTILFNISNLGFVSISCMVPSSHIFLQVMASSKTLTFTVDNWSLSTLTSFHSTCPQHKLIIPIQIALPNLTASAAIRFNNRLSFSKWSIHTGHLFQPTAAWDLGRARTKFINNVTPNSKQRHHKL